MKPIRSSLRYRWTWPHVPHATAVRGPGYGLEVAAYALVLVAFTIPVVRTVTGLSLLTVAALLGVHAAWMSFARHLLVPRMASSRRMFDAVVVGNLLASTGVATAFVVFGGTPDSVLWGALILYATTNGTIQDFEPSLALQLVHVSGPLATIPWFQAQDADGAVAGPILAAAFAATGYHLAAGFTERARAHRRAVEARLARAEREAAELRLARDLHDVLGSTLGTVKLYADALAGSNARFAAPLSDVAQAGLDDLRSLLDALAPPAGKLELAFEAIARRIAPVGVTVRVGGTSPAQVPGPVRVAAVRIVQEAVHNAIRHGGATAIEIESTTDAQRMRLAITDDGCGFETSAPARSHGRGLAAMKERVAELGGTLAIESAAGTGTRIVVSVPVGEAAQRSAA